VPDLIGNAPEPLPPNRSQEKRWTLHRKAQVRDCPCRR
jgi:hypothetical protein